MPPFHRKRFEDLPEKPRCPHEWFEIPESALKMSSKPFGELNVTYRVLGPDDAPPLLLIHGLMTSGYSWRYVVRDFAFHYRVYVPDLPGSGGSGKPVAEYSGTNYATWLSEFVDALGIRGCVCLGNSLGGYLSMRAVLADPTLFRKLINLHSPGIRELRLRALHLAMKIPGLRRAFSWFVRRRALRFAHKNVHYYDESLKSLEEARTYGEPLSTVEGSRAFANILGEVLNPAELQQFARALAAEAFPIPLLLLYARQDPMVPAWIGPRLHALVPNAQFAWVEQSSHFAHVDTPEWVLLQVYRFVGE
jgi:pimeloyl-ACP methyl ester carboxylesterase